MEHNEPVPGRLDVAWPHLTRPEEESTPLEQRLASLLHQPPGGNGPAVDVFHIDPDDTAA